VSSSFPTPAHLIASVKSVKDDSTSAYEELTDMPKKKHKGPKEGPVWKLSTVEATLRAKPRYSGFACGHGAHGDSKYNRAKERARFHAQLKTEL